MDPSKAAAAAAAAAATSAAAAEAAAAEQEPKPTNLNQLKHTLKIGLIEKLERIPNYDDNSSENGINEKLKDFFTNFDIKKVEHFNEIEAAITQLQVYNKQTNPKKEKFIAEVSSYVDAAIPIFNHLDKFITDGIKPIDTSLNSKLTTNFDKEIEPIIQAIDALKKKPDSSSGTDASSGATASTEEENKFNSHLETLKTFLKTMMTEFITSMKKIMEEKFSVDEIKQLIESDPNDVEQHITDKINEILRKLLQDVTSGEDAFRALLIKKKTDSSGEIIDDASIQKITPSFGDMIAKLQNFFVENGENDTLFKEINEVYKKLISDGIETTDKKVKQLGEVPVMAHEEEVAEGGNGDGSILATLDTYPVSNKSQKNRNKGKGNSKGRGKGKGKGRKPNATKKNNRH